MSCERFKLKREKITLMMTVERTDGKDLSAEDAKAFADALLAERGERGEWTFDGVARLSYDKANVFYVR
jgi:hypothetical protein